MFLFPHTHTHTTCLMFHSCLSTYTASTWSAEDEREGSTSHPGTNKLVNARQARHYFTDYELLLKAKLQKKRTQEQQHIMCVCHEYIFLFNSFCKWSRMHFRSVLLCSERKLGRWESMRSRNSKPWCRNMKSGFSQWRNCILTNVQL